MSRASSGVASRTTTGVSMRQCRRVITDIRNVLRANRMVGIPVCLHTALRSFGSPRPTADDVIDGFLAEGCTVMVPTFSHGIFGVIPPPDLRPERNGTNYDDGALNDAGRD